MKRVELWKITLREAGKRISVSSRQIKRIGQSIRERGIKGLVHGNRGQPSNNRLKEPLRTLPRNKHHARGVKDYNYVYLAAAPSREGDPYPFLVEHR